MTSLDILNCCIGTISSRADHSCKFSVVTPELLSSQSGILMQWHGRACRVVIYPHEGAPEETVAITTERGEKTPSQRLRAVIHVHWKQAGEPMDSFETFYRHRMSIICEGYKQKNLNDE